MDNLFSGLSGNLWYLGNTQMRHCGQNSRVKYHAHKPVIHNIEAVDLSIKQSQQAISKQG
jgi:hypothetical protein